MGVGAHFHQASRDQPKLNRRCELSAKANRPCRPPDELTLHLRIATPG